MAVVVTLFACGAVVNAIAAPTVGRGLQAAGLVGATALSVPWALGRLTRGGRWVAAGAVVCSALGAAVTAVSAPGLGNVLFAAGALGLGTLAVPWARRAA